MHRHAITLGLTLSALLLTLTGCASEPKRNWARGERLAEAGPSDEAARPRPPKVRMFISPAGEPFRGENGLAAWFAQADANHDGAVTYAEFEADAMRFFKVLDANHDGVIDGFEIQAYERDIAPEIAAEPTDDGPGDRPARAAGGGGERRGGGGGREGGSGGQGGREQGAQPISPPTPPAGQVRAGRLGAARFGLLNEPEPLTNADEDVDGRVTLAEWKHATQRRFDRLDKAKTGRLILSDLLLPPSAKRPPPPRSEPSR